MVTFFLLMTLFIIGIAVGMMLRRAQRKKSYSPADREAESYSLTTRASEQHVDVEADAHYDRVEMHREVTNGERGSVLAPNYDRLGPHKDISEGEKAGVLEPHYDRLGPHKDISEGEKAGVLEPHYDSLEPHKDVSESKRADVLEPYSDTIGPHEEIPLSERADAKGTGPQSGSYDPNRVYAEVDKSKKKKNRNTEGGPSATTAQSVDIVEQHYEFSEVFGQDWFGNEIGEKYEGNLGDVGKGSPSSTAKAIDQLVEPCTPNTVDALVYRNKKRNAEKLNGALKVEDGVQIQNSSNRGACEANTQQNDGEQNSGQQFPRGVQMRTPYTGIGLHSTQDMELSEAQNDSSLSIGEPN